MFAEGSTEVEWIYGKINRMTASDGVPLWTVRASNKAIEVSVMHKPVFFIFVVLGLNILMGFSQL